MSGSGSSPEMVVKKDVVSGGWVLAARGELDAQSIGPLREAAVGAAAGFPVLVLDFGAVTFADSAALNLLLILHRSTRLYVAAPCARLLCVLEMAGADRVLRIYPSVAAACAAAAG
ncbi:STAS domain-containing protein [Streptomyces sp. NPDC059900]|uniref:STAS domain-containing protein n=1 Tax=Streptomyces sp. NPDC059900 TaxID=3155816 RepID=UPI0034300D60